MDYFNNDPEVSGVLLLLVVIVLYLLLIGVSFCIDLYSHVCEFRQTKFAK